MKFKKMTDEHIQLDVEKINGYLSAIETMNIADNIGVEYAFINLPQKLTLLQSIENNVANIYPGTIIANWHISLEEVNEHQLVDSLNTWFFCFGKAVTLKNELPALCAGFMDLLKQLVYTPAIYRVTMIPPVWYATDWETFAFDTDNGFFLLEFNFDT
ncbi:hypothetical protein ACI2I2_16615 [Scandinavium sp. NPDC088450]|uniref:hypothetical protein n=1 Tax=Scandinavium sp. NPDC088450 TaxID=3364514 RepID=UPI00384B70D7